MGNKVQQWLEKVYPWLIEVNVHGAVVGVLCIICHDYTNDSLSNLQLQKRSREIHQTAIS